MLLPRSRRLVILILLRKPDVYKRQRVESLCEHNPMLGHRGCRLGNTYPEITQMQTRAILDMWAVTRVLNFEWLITRSMYSTDNKLFSKS